MSERSEFFTFSCLKIEINNEKYFYFIKVDFLRENRKKNVDSGRYQAVALF